LGQSYLELGQYTNARTEYEAALKIANEIKHERHQAVTLTRLGLLALRQNELVEAREKYMKALELFQHMGEAQGEAEQWHQLGMVAQEARDWDEAERCYKESVNLKEHLGDLAGVARTSNQLASVAESMGRFEESEKWARRSLEIKEKLGNPQQIATGHHMLAVSLLRLNRFDESAIYIEKAINLYETVQDFDNTVKAYSIAAEIAEKRGRMEEVHEWRRKEQESFAAFAGSDTQIKQSEPLIAAIVAASQGNEQAFAQVEPTLQNMEKGDDTNRAFAKAARQILAGDRDFGILTEGLSRTPSLIIRRVLQALNGEGTDLPSPRPSPEIRERGQGQAQPQAQEGGVTLPQLLEYVERAAAGGDKELGGQLFTAFQQMSRADDPTSSALGNVLLRVLVGEREPDLSKLPDEVASAVRGMLGRLKNK
jgi:tetratricopeptide (TPR) repeat protein